MCFSCANLIINRISSEAIMVELKIVELPNNRFSIWLNGENLNLSSDNLAPKVLEILRRCMNYLLNTVL